MSSSRSPSPSSSHNHTRSNQRQRHRRRSSRSRSRSRSRSVSPSNIDHHRHHTSNTNTSSSSSSRYKSEKPISDRVKYAGMTGAQIERAKAKERGLNTHKSELNNTDYKELKLILQNLTLSRIHIKQALGFIYDKIEAAEDICYILKKSLCNNTTPPAIKIARLYLLSDLLHNSSAPIKNASHFRIEIQKILPQIFEEFGSMRRGIIGRMTLHQVDERIKRVLAAWEEFSILSYPFLMGLESAYYQSENDVLAYQACFVSEENDTATTTTTSSSTIKEETTTNNTTNTNNGDYDLDHYKRQAKLAGVYISEKDTIKSLKFKLEQYQLYQTSKYGTSKVVTAQEMAGM